MVAGPPGFNGGWARRSSAERSESAARVGFTRSTRITHRPDLKNKQVAIEGKWSVAETAGGKSEPATDWLNNPIFRIGVAVHET